MTRPSDHRTGGDPAVGRALTRWPAPGPARRGAQPSPCLAVVLGLLLSACGDTLSRGDNITLAMSPESLTFEPLPLGRSTTQEIAVRHAGSEGVVKLGRPQLPPGDFSVAGDAVALRPGETAVFTVSYAPSDALGDAAVLEVAHDALAIGPLRAAITALAPYPILRGGDVAFGAVLVGEVAEAKATLQNEGSYEVEVASVQIETDDGAPFGPHELPDLPLLLGPGDSVSWSVRYAPEPVHGTGRHTGRFRIRANHVAADNTLIEIAGRAITPGLSVSPGKLSLGTVVPGDSAVDTVTLANVGDLDLTVHSLELQGEPGLALLAPPATPFTLSPGAGKALTVRVAPTTELPGPVLGVLEVKSSDVLPTRTVTVAGRSARPALQTVPDELLDLGVVAAFHRHERMLRLVNSGGAPLTILEVAPSQEGHPGFAITPSTLPVVLAPGGEARVGVSFTNPGEAEGVVWSGVTITTDEAAPATVSLRARLAPFPECLPELSPATLEFGSVVAGAVVDRTLNVSNAGSLPCELRTLAFVDCLSSDGLCEPDPTRAPSFRLGLEPPALGTVLLFGDSLSIPIRFEATVPAGPRAALPLLTFAKGLNASATLTTPSPYGGVPPMLRAVVGEASIVATPTELTFGLTNPGCSAPAQTVSLTRTGDAPLNLATIDTSDCPALALVPPPLPAPLHPVTAVEVPVSFAPTGGGLLDCQLRFEAADGGAATVHVLGVGATTAAREDAFVQAKELAVDILFVVDSSGSMGDEQAALVDGFQALVDAAAVWNVSYRIAVTTTDPGEGGRIRRPIANNAWPWSFALSASVGTNGSGDERGLQTAWFALQPGMLVESDVPCTQDAGCVEGLECVSGKCGGANAGFVRPDAILAIVWVTDEDDHSCETGVSDFVAFFQSLKPPGLMKAYAIVGDPPTSEVPTGGCGGGGNACAACDDQCSSQGWGPKNGAEAGRRYHEAVSQMNGKSFSICSFGDPETAPVLQEIGADAFKPNDTFPLTELPVPETLEVLVAGVACSSGWSWIEASNEVVFEPTGACFPGPGQSVRIRYDAACQ